MEECEKYSYTKCAYFELYKSILMATIKQLAVMVSYRFCLVNKEKQKQISSFLVDSIVFTVEKHVRWKYEMCIHLISQVTRVEREYF